MYEELTWTMKVSAPKPFFFEGGPRAVLMLHGFTGSSADVRMLGRFLQKEGYTCMGPQYRGHGVPPEELLEFGPNDWWQDVQDAYQALKDKGYDEIVVCGLSLGGVMSLRVASEMRVKGVIPMCAPTEVDATDRLYKGVKAYAREYKSREAKSPEQIEQEMAEFKPMPTLTDLRAFVKETKSRLGDIFVPALVIQGAKDQMVDPESAHEIYEGINAFQKELLMYEQSGHVITLDKEKEKLHQDVLDFLETLDWSV